MVSVRRALALSFAESYLLIAIGLTSNVLLARLLTPQQIGIFSVSLAIIGVAQVLRDFGISSYLIQERELSDVRLRTAFGASLVMGVVLFFTTYFGAALAGRIYADDRVAQTLRICALNFLAMPFCTVYLAMLRRQMAFNRLAAVNVLAALCGAAASTGLAFRGHGVTSLAIGSVVVTTITGAGAWFMRSDRRALRPALSEWRLVLRFGAQNSSANVVTTIAMDINDLAIGKILGFAPVAMLSRGQGLMNMFHRDLMAAIRNVAYPAFAKASRETEPLEPRYIASVTNVTAIAWPFYGFVSLFALELLRLLFGPQWDEAAPLVPIFCLAGALAATFNLIGPVVLAVGRVDLITKAEFVFQPFRAALIVVAALMFRSITACAIALLVAFTFQLPLLYFIKGRCIPNDYSTLRFNLWSSMKVSLASLILPALLVFSAGYRRTGPTELVVAAVLCIVSWITALFAFQHSLVKDPLFQRILGKLRHQLSPTHPDDRKHR